MLFRPYARDLFFFFNIIDISLDLKKINYSKNSIEMCIGKANFCKWGNSVPGFPNNMKLLTQTNFNIKIPVL